MGLLRHSLAALGAAAALPVGAVGLALRPSWRIGLRERLGETPASEPGGVWVHAASVGEARAAQALIHALSALPALPAGSQAHFISASSPSGREISRAAFPRLPVSLSPIDHPWCVDRALARVRPSALVLVETELWPQWIAAAARRQIPLAIVSARLSDQSFPRYLRIAPLLRSTLGRITAVGTRCQQDADRFVALGVEADRVCVTGDLKLASSAEPRALAPELARLLAGARIFVAGSTHEGEEAAALSALDAADRAGHAIALVLAPRRLDRIEAVLREVSKTGRRVVRRSESAGAAPLEAGDVLLLDTLGELAAVYGAAALAFVGGTLFSVGGHNVLEPVGAGCPVLYGPRTENVRDAVSLLEAWGAGRGVQGAAGLADALSSALGDLPARRDAAARGRAELAQHRDAAERSAALVAQLVARAAPSKAAP